MHGTLIPVVCSELKTMRMQPSILAAVVATATVFSIIGTIYFMSGTSRDVNSNKIITDTISNALQRDEVLVRVHDSAGNLISEQKTHNIITSNGAIWFCVEQNRCTSQITGSVPAVPNVAGATWWVQFISGTTNANEPTAADCTSPNGGGAISGQVTGGRCVTNFGAPPAQYLAGGSILTVSVAAGAGQLRGAGNFDTTNNFVQTTRATVCSIVNDGTAPASGTCQFTDVTPVLTNMSGGSLTVNGLALASGTASGAAAGPLIIAEATIAPVTLVASDTISVQWSIVT